MKKLIYSIALSTLCMLPASCSLEEETYTNVEKEKYMNTAKEANDVLLGVYRTNVEDAMYAYNLSFYFSMGTDISQVEGNSTENFRIVPTNAYPTTQSEIQTTWRSLYKGVYRANDFLERISVKINSYTDSDKELATLYIAEARALRAMFYFELVRRYGNVPLMTSTAMSNQDRATFEQADPVDVYKFIETDLLYARDILPYATDAQLRSSNAYRFSKGGVLGLLAKVYATWAGWPLQDESKWGEAVKAARQLVESGKHSLLPSYQSLWYNTCNGIWDSRESLIEVSFFSPTYSGNSDPVGRIGKWNGIKTTTQAGKSGSCAGNVKVVHSFVLDWREDTGVNVENPVSPDQRLALSIGNYKHGHNDNSAGIAYEGTFLWAQKVTDTPEVAIEKDLNPEKNMKEKQNYTPAKWDIDTYMESIPYINNDKSNVNWYVLRYADVLLLYAEALNEVNNGPTTEAYNAVNAVRRRAYGNPSNTSACDIPEGMDYTQFRDAIRKERAYELAFEGHRRTDLVRWGIYYETVQETANKLSNWYGEAYYPVARFTQKNHHELLPIPQRDMDLCPKFVQNPGWKVGD